MVEITEAHAELAAAGVALFGFIFIYAQIGLVRKTISFANEASLYEQNNEVRKAVIHHPETRPYIYGREPIHPGHAHYDLALTISEMLANYLEHLQSKRDDLPKNQIFRSRSDKEEKIFVDRFIESALERSPLTVRVICGNPKSYTDAIVAVADQVRRRNDARAKSKAEPAAATA